MNELDMDVLEFARKISMLSIDTPLANKFDAEHGQKRNRWWSCQREHLTVWIPIIIFRNILNRYRINFTLVQSIFTQFLKQYIC